MRIRSLDALRGCAALAVAVPHYLMSKNITGDWAESIAIISVEVFFVLSGFVLAPQILYCLGGDFIHRFRIFLVRRWVRTVPPYLLALILTTILTDNLSSGAFHGYLVFLNNFLRVEDSSNYFPIAWSLAVEEWFYLFFPLFMILTRRAGLTLTKSLVIFLLLFFTLRLGGAVADPDWGTSVRRIIVYRLDSIAFGFVLYLTVSRLPQRLGWIAMTALAGLAAVSGAVLLWLISESHAGDAILPRIAYFYTAPLFAASLIALVHAADRGGAPRGLGRISVLLGEVSYDVYLLHVPIIMILGAMPGLFGGMWEFPFYIALLLTLSYAIRVTLERPLLAARPKYRDADAAEMPGWTAPDQNRV